MLASIDYFSLDDPKQNEELYNLYAGGKYKHKKKLFQLTDNAIVYSYRSEFFCLDSSIKKITYYMKYSVDTKPKIGQFVYQSLVWTDTLVHDVYLVGVASKIVFEYLMPKFHTIVTDSQQTWKGKRFWQILIGIAFRKGFNIYYHNFRTRELVKLDDPDELYQFQKDYDIWGETDKHMLKRMVITDKVLK